MKNNKLLACPYIVWMILFTIIPLGIVFYYALTDSVTDQFTIANLSSIGNYLPIFLRSIWLALFAALLLATQWKKAQKLHPVLFVAIGALCGLLIQF